MTEVDVHEHFQDAEQQIEADYLGMWLFLTTEILTFGGILMAAIVYRVVYPDGFGEASAHLRFWIGTGNTAVLLASGLFVALAVTAAREGRRRETFGHLVATGLLGLIFLGIKAWEWHAEYGQGLIPHLGRPFPLEAEGAQIFYNLYFAGTGLHFLHLGVGIAVVAVVAARVLSGGLPLPQRQTVVTMTGLYWSLVDVVWILLYTALYLAGR